MVVVIRDAQKFRHIYGHIRLFTWSKMQRNEKKLIGNVPSLVLGGALIHHFAL